MNDRREIEIKAVYSPDGDLYRVGSVDPVSGDVDVQVYEYGYYVDYPFLCMQVLTKLFYLSRNDDTIYIKVTDKWKRGYHKIGIDGYNALYRGHSFDIYGSVEAIFYIMKTETLWFRIEVDNNE